MARETLAEKIKDKKFKEELLKIICQAVDSATDPKFESMHQRMEEITFRLDLIIQKLDMMNSNPLIPKIKLPRKIVS